VALGEFSPEAAEAATKAALFQGALEILTQEWKLGNLDTAEFLTSVDNLVTELETKTVAEIEVGLSAKAAGPQFSVMDMLPEEDRAAIQSGINTEVTFTPVEAALTAALDTMDGRMDAMSEQLITFDAEYAAVTPEATDTIQTAIYAIDGTVPFVADTGSTDLATRRLQNTRIDIPVYYVPQNAPPSGSSAAGGGGGGKDGKSVWGGKGQFAPVVTVNFNGPVSNPAAVQRAIRDGMADFYAAVSREGVAL
jgi:hypothetical protein